MKKIILFIICFLINNFILSQKRQPIIVKPISNIPTILIKDSLQVVVLNVKNLSTQNIYISNVPITNFGYKISKKVKGEYVSIDSNCTFLPQPLYPNEGLKIIKFKRNGEINIPFNFPPWCSFLENGDYKIKFSFTYSKRNGINMAETEWYEYRVNIMK